MIELRRGAVVSFADRGDYTGKPRPGVIVQRDSSLRDSPSITLCGLTTEAMPSHMARPALTPSPANGLGAPCYCMVDKIASIRRAKVGEVFGLLNDD